MHLNPSYGQLFQYLQLATNMMQDLKKQHSEEKDLDGPEEVSASARDLQNAFLGCFYLSSAYG
jgi:hypothetical protein